MRKYIGYILIASFVGVINFFIHLDWYYLLIGCILCGFITSVMHMLLKSTHFTNYIAQFNQITNDIIKSYIFMQSIQSSLVISAFVFALKYIR